MADYIKREDAIDAITEQMHEYMIMYSNAALGCRAAAKKIESIPSADVQPVVHGEWVDGGVDGVGACDIEYRYNKCSVCGYEYSFPMKYNFCPNCGADMRSNAQVMPSKDGGT